MDRPRRLCANREGVATGEPERFPLNGILRRLLPRHEEPLIRPMPRRRQNSDEPPSTWPPGRPAAPAGSNPRTGSRRRTTSPARRDTRGMRRRGGSGRPATDDVRRRAGRTRRVGRPQAPGPRDGLGGPAPRSGQARQACPRCRPRSRGGLRLRSRKSKPPTFGSGPRSICPKALKYRWAAVPSIPRSPSSRSAWPARRTSSFSSRSSSSGEGRLARGHHWRPRFLKSPTSSFFSVSSALRQGRSQGRVLCPAEPDIHASSLLIFLSNSCSYSLTLP
jgi:hypothetical protein